MYAPPCPQAHWFFSLIKNLLRRYGCSVWLWENPRRLMMAGSANGHWENSNPKLHIPERCKNNQLLINFKANCLTIGNMHWFQNLYLFYLIFWCQMSVEDLRKVHFITFVGKFQCWFCLFEIPTQRAGINWWIVWSVPIHLLAYIEQRNGQRVSHPSPSGSQQNNLISYRTNNIPEIWKKNIFYELKEA